MTEERKDIPMMEEDEKKEVKMEIDTEATENEPPLKIEPIGPIGEKIEPAIPIEEQIKQIGSIGEKIEPAIPLNLDQIEPIKPIGQIQNPTQVDIKMEEDDYYLGRMKDIFDRIKKSPYNYFYYIKSETDDFTRIFTKERIPQLSVGVFDFFINDNMRYLFIKMLDSLASSYYDEEMSKLFTFYIHFFFTKLELVSDKGWEIFSMIFSHEKVISTRARSWNSYTRDWYEPPAWVDELTTYIIGADGFNKICEYILTVNLKKVNLIIEILGKISRNVKTLPMTDIEKELANVMKTILLNMNFQDEKFEEVQKFIGYLEQLESNEPKANGTFSATFEQSTSYLVVKKIGNNLRTFNSRKLFLKHCNTLLNNYFADNNPQFETTIKLNGLFYPTISIVNDSIQKEILLNAIPILRFLNSSGLTVEIVNNCMEILTHGHISIVEVIVPFMNDIIGKVEANTLYSLIQLLDEIEDKRIAHFNIFVMIMRINSDLMERMFEMFFDNCEIDIGEMVQSLQPIIEVTSEGDIFNKLIVKLREFMENGYEEEKKILFIIKCLLSCTSKAGFDVFQEKDFVGLFTEIVENVVGLGYSVSRQNIVDTSLEVLLAISMMNEEEIIMELFMILWGIFMNEEVDPKMRCRLLYFYNQYFRIESEQKDFAILSLQEHIENEEEIMMFDSPEGILLIQLIIENINKAELIKSGDGYRFGGDINEIPQITTLKRLLVLTKNKETIDSIMSLMVKLVKSVTIQQGWKVVVEWINDINANYTKEDPSTENVEKEDELFYTLKLLNELFIEWTGKDEGKRISHIKSLKGKDMVFNITLISPENIVVKKTMEISSKKTIAQIKSMLMEEPLLSEFKKGENVSEEIITTLKIEGVDEFEESTQIDELLLPNEAEIEFKCEKKQKEEKERSTVASTYYKESKPIDNLSKITREEVENLMSLGFDKKLSIYTLCKYYYYGDHINMACNALFENAETLEMELLTAMSNGDDYTLPGDEQTQTTQNTVDLSFIKLVSNSQEITVLFDTLRKNYSQKIDELVWEMLRSLPSIDYIVQKVKRSFSPNMLQGFGNWNVNFMGQTELQNDNLVLTLLTEESPYILLYTLQIVDRLLFPENETELSTTDTNSDTMLREQIVKSQTIFNQFIESLLVVVQRKNKLIVEIIETFSRVFRFFIHKACKYNYVELQQSQLMNVFTSLFTLIINSPTDHHVSGIFIDGVSALLELFDIGMNIQLTPNFHNFIVDYFNSQQQFDYEHLTTMKFINIFVDYHIRNPVLLQNQIPFYVNDLTNCLEIYGKGKALFYYFKVITSMLENSRGEIANKNEVMTYLINTLMTYEPNQQFTDSTDYYSTGLLRLTKILAETTPITEEMAFALVSKIYYYCFSSPLIYKIKTVRNGSYELLETMFTRYPSIIQRFGREVFNTNFEYKITNKIDIVPKLSRTGHRGIRNLGVTCYINSTIQFLYLMEDFREQILRVIKNDEMKVVGELQKLFISLKSGNQESYNANKLIDAVQTSRKVTNLKTEQHDASDFFIKLIDSIEDELNDVDKKRILSTFKLIMSNETESIENRVNERNERQEEYAFLDLTMSGKKNVYECFKELFKPIYFTGENRLKTEDGVYYNAKKQTRMQSLPHYLLLQLNRFETFDTQTMKINDECEMPLELDVTPYMKNPENETNNKYRLKGVVIHSGTAVSGHYYTYGYLDNQWILFDDDRISYALEDVVIRNMNGYKNITGYLFVYEKEQWQSYDMNCEIDDKILQLIHEEENKISDDIMYHDDNNIHFLLNYYEHFDLEIREKFLLYCCSSSFGMLMQGKENIPFVDSIINLLKRCEPNVENGKALLKTIMEKKIIKDVCFNADKQIRSKAAEVIQIVIHWVGCVDSVELMNENEILFEFYQHLRQLLKYSRDYPKYLNEYFSLFNHLAMIGPQICYKLAQANMLYSFWRYFENKDDETDKSYDQLLTDTYPNLTNYVEAFARVICSVNINGKLANTISPESNSTRNEFIDLNAFEMIKESFLKTSMFHQFVLYNVDASKRIFKYISYNNFPITLTVLNSIKETIDSCMTTIATSEETDLRFRAMLSIAEALLEIEDCYHELRVQALFNNFSPSSVASISGEVPNIVTNGILMRMSEVVEYKMLISEFTVRMAIVHPAVKEVLLDNPSVIPLLLKPLNMALRKQFDILKNPSLMKTPLKYVEFVKEVATVEIRQNAFYVYMIKCYSFWKESKTRKLNINENEMKMEYDLLKTQLHNYQSIVTPLEKSLHHFKDTKYPGYHHRMNELFDEDELD